jgi:hypothetical protein
MNRSTPLRAYTPLKRRTPLAATSGLSPGTGLSRKPAERSGKPQKAPRDTGPARLVRSVVLDRDQYACLACGKPVGLPGTWWSIQHRLARGQGGTNDLFNLILLCGSATSAGCHLRCEQRDREMQAMGYWLESWQNPAAEPVMVHSEHGSGVTVWLAADGTYRFEAPGEAA